MGCLSAFICYLAHAYHMCYIHHTCNMYCIKAMLSQGSSHGNREQRRLQGGVEGNGVRGAAKQDGLAAVATLHFPKPHSAIVRT